MNIGEEIRRGIIVPEPIVMPASPAPLPSSPAPSREPSREPVPAHA